MQRRIDLVLWLTMALGACSGGQSTSETGPPPEDTAETPSPAEEPTPPAPAEPETPEPAGPSAFEQQATEGAGLYKEHCASCHGASGEGVKAPKVVGLKEGALPLDPPKTAKMRKTKFKTVADIADFVVKNMPPKKAGSLTNDQYLAILAFDLKANGIDLKDKKLDMELAKTLDVPR
ncbi:MAG TPA: cytochrome c [Polyangiaceae bacterium]|jgi:mono/diheme cytochrome c family protein|nr:cytochrome c [Polyangiaceae bacterium]